MLYMVLWEHAPFRLGLLGGYTNHMDALEHEPLTPLRACHMAYTPRLYKHLQLILRLNHLDRCVDLRG